jgi:hypothetical protein
MTTGQFPVGRNCRERKASRTTQIWCSPTRITKAPIVAKAPGRPGDALLAAGRQKAHSGKQALPRPAVVRFCVPCVCQMIHRLSQEASAGR